MRRKNNKKGFELSVGFIVILIITLVIFTSSIFIINKFFVQTREIEETLSTENAQQIERLIAQGQPIVVVPNVVVTELNKPVTAGIGFTNILDEGDFYVFVGFAAAFEEDETEMTDVDFDAMKKWTLYGNGPYTLEKSEREVIKVVIEPQAFITTPRPQMKTKPGTYVYNVCISYYPILGLTATPPIPTEFNNLELKCGELGSAGGTSQFDAEYLSPPYKLQVKVE
ncbi:MAG: hypothetical protein AABY13_01970 [Nanoarchaeota archaeon]